MNAFTYYSIKWRRKIFVSSIEKKKNNEMIDAEIVNCVHLLQLMSGDISRCFLISFHFTQKAVKTLVSTIGWNKHPHNSDLSIVIWAVTLHLFVWSFLVIMFFFFSFSIFCCCCCCCNAWVLFTLRNQKLILFCLLIFFFSFVRFRFVPV